MPENFQAKIEELLMTNGNCDYPCWWGLIPGKTKYDTALDLFESLSLSGNTYSYEQRDPVFHIKIPVPESINSLGYIRFEMIRDGENSNNIKAFSIYGYHYSILEILNSVGEPSEIYYAGPIWFPVNDIEYELELYYPTRGISVGFSSYTTTPDPKNAIIICDLDKRPGPDDSVGFLFWNPKVNMTFWEMLELPFWGDWLPPFAPIEVISNMNPQTFYLNFSQPDPVCLEIDTNLYAAEVWAEGN
jgi:hypothetical protein